MQAEAFRECVQRYLHLNGNSQSQLANEIGIHDKVLSRKLRGSKGDHLNAQEVRKIVKSLANWRAIITRGEAIHLLELADMKEGCFRPEEWQEPPLSQLSQLSMEPGELEQEA